MTHVQHIFLQNATLVAPHQPELDGKKRDLLIENGMITQIEKKIAPPQYPTLRDAHVSIGWLDFGTQICEPGLEHREDLASAQRAALAGGFSTLVMQPTTLPAIHSKSEIAFIKNKNHAQIIDIETIGAISVDCNGKDLAEMLDMHQAGAIAFGDGHRAIQDAGLLLRALQYSQILDALIINSPHIKSIAPHGQMHEGVVSTSLGLVGLPAMAEEMMVQRDLNLLKYANGRLHFSNISTAASVALVREAKAKELRVTASVAVLNLLFTDAALMNFDTHFKVMPPLRGDDDRAALWEGLRDGTIDFVASNHVPQDEEAKNLEFPYADFGTIGLETAMSATLESFLQNGLSLSNLVEKWTIAPRRLLNLPIPTIKIGEKACLTIFDPNAEFIFEQKNIQSKSKNSPFIGKKLRGRVRAVVNKGQVVLNP